MSSPDLTPIEQAAADALARETGAHTPMTLRYLAWVMVAAVEPLIRAQVLAEVLPLIRDLTDPDECWFDHHGGCQAHGYLSLKPGQMCPHQEAKELLAARPEAVADA